jgi:hypothetical protein
VGNAARFAGFALPTSNTTYTPNQFFDVCLPNYSRGCVRLVAYLIRKTLGWSDAHGRPQAERHRVPYSELERCAGISRDMIRPAVEEAMAGNFIRRVQLGRPNSAGSPSATTVYELKWDDAGEYVKDPRRFRGFYAGEGNRTYIPNQFFDVVVPHETLAVTKVVGSVIRFSIGFQTKWGHRRQLVSLSYQDIQRYAHLRDRKTLAAALRTARSGNYVQRVEEGVFDPDAGRLSRPATYAVKWLNKAPERANSRKTPPGSAIPAARSEMPTGDGRKTPPDERSENPTDIQITETNKTLKQQDATAAVAFERLRKVGFDAEAAQTIASKFDSDRIQRQIEWLSLRSVKTSRLGLLRAAIEHDWPAPGRKRLASEPARRGSDSGVSFDAALAQAKERLLKSSSTTSS